MVSENLSVLSGRSCLPGWSRNAFATARPGERVPAPSARVSDDLVDAARRRGVTALATAGGTAQPTTRFTVAAPPPAAIPPARASKRPARFAFKTKTIGPAIGPVTFTTRENAR